MALQQIDILLAGVRDTSGNVLSGGKVYTYNAGTLTPRATYVDSAGATPATNPIILDSAGRAQVYADGAFKLVVDDSSNANIYAWDNLYFARVTSAVSQWPDIYGGTSTGAASVYAVTVPLTISGYAAGQEFKFIANHDTTGAAATLNVNSQGAVSLVKGPANTALAAGDIKSGDIVCVVYDSSGGGRFKITTIAGSVSPTPLFIERANGRVGIGTTSPAQVLDVQGGNIAEGSASTLDHTITQFTASAAGPTLALQKSRNATLGANTIVTNGDTLGSVVFRGANGTSYSDAAAISAVSNGVPGASADMPGALIFSTSADASATPTERIKIESGGNVLIGQASGGANRVQIWDTVGKVYLGNNIESLATGTNNSGGIYLGNPPTSTTAPTAAIEASWGGASDPQCHIGISRDGNKTRFSAFYADSTLRFYNANVEAARFNAGGELLIGYTSDNGAYKLQVNSQIFATSSTIATSDGNYKENVTDITNGLEILTQLRPVQFTWKNHPVHNFNDECTVGFIAQEVQSVLSATDYKDAIVKHNQVTLPDGNTENFLGIAEGNLIALAVAAIKQLNAEVTSLKARVATLEGA